MIQWPVGSNGNQRKPQWKGAYFHWNGFTPPSGTFWSWPAGTMWQTYTRKTIQRSSDMPAPCPLPCSYRRGSARGQLGGKCWKALPDSPSVFLGHRVGLAVAFSLGSEPLGLPPYSLDPSEGWAYPRGSIKGHWHGSSLQANRKPSCFLKGQRLWQLHYQRNLFNPSLLVIQLPPRALNCWLLNLQEILPRAFEATSTQMSRKSQSFGACLLPDRLYQSIGETALSLSLSQRSVCDLPGKSHLVASLYKALHVQRRK